MRLAEELSFAKIIDDIRMAKSLPTDTYYFSENEDPATDLNKEEYILTE